MMRYGIWNGNPRGTPEDESHCIVELWDRFIGRQCARDRGHGHGNLFCKQHAKKEQQRQDRIKKETEK